MYQLGIGGGAMIVDKFGGARGEPPVPLRSTVVSPRAEARSTTKSKAESKKEAKTEAKANRGSAVLLHVKSDNLKLD